MMFLWRLANIAVVFFTAGVMWQASMASWEYWVCLFVGAYGMASTERLGAVEERNKATGDESPVNPTCDRWGSSDNPAEPSSTRPPFIQVRPLKHSRAEQETHNGDH